MILMTYFKGKGDEVPLIEKQWPFTTHRGFFKLCDKFSTAILLSK